MISKARPFIQLACLGTFFFLMFSGNAQVWMGFIFLSILTSALWGRFYCGFACPINTLIRPVNWLKQNLNIKDKKTPIALKSQKLRGGILILFLIGISYTIYTITQGRKFPLPLIIIPLGLITTLIISENAWHRYLCPWGILFSLTGRFSKFGIQQSGCSSCSICAKNCPGDAIKIENGMGAIIDPTYCLLCFECTSNCPINVMEYKSFSKKSKAEKSKTN